MKKQSLLTRFIKNILLFGSLFIILSVVMDWYRKPTAPEQFAEQVLYDINQQPKVIAQLSHQKPLLLYFWGSWCKFCEFSSPAVDKLAQEGHGILGVALKSGTDEEVKKYLQENRYQFPTINDPAGEFSKSWDIQATPTFIIVKDGKMISHTTGFSTYWGIKIRLWLTEWAR
ncbi:MULTISPECIES: protein disulfide oxidoreductase [Glaesserella]|nr:MULTISPECIES: protein disulfide oxidoreductase [Glaesserella]